MQHLSCKNHRAAPPVVTFAQSAPNQANYRPKSVRTSVQGECSRVPVISQTDVSDLKDCFSWKITLEGVS